MAFSSRINLEQCESSYGTGSTRFFARFGRFGFISLAAIARAVKRKRGIPATTNGSALRAPSVQALNPIESPHLLAPQTKGCSRVRRPTHEMRTAAIQEDC